VERQRTVELTASLGYFEAVAEDLKASVTRTVALRQELERLAGPSGVVHNLRAKADELRERFLTYNDDVHAVREQQEAIKAAQRDALAKFHEVREESSRLMDEIGKAVARLAQVEAGMGNVVRTHEPPEKPR
jgi:uncharacterized coiled-coil DUF342 family protein